MKTKLQQLNNNRSKIFHSQIFFQPKQITLPGEFLKMKQLIVFGHDLYILLTTIFQNGNLKYTGNISKKIF